MWRQPPRLSGEAKRAARGIRPDAASVARSGSRYLCHSERRRAKASTSRRIPLTNGAPTDGKEVEPSTLVIPSALFLARGTCFSSNRSARAICNRLVSERDVERLNVILPASSSTSPLPRAPVSPCERRVSSQPPHHPTQSSAPPVSPHSLLPASRSQPSLPESPPASARWPTANPSPAERSKESARR